jgi:hypothetical protein
VSIDLHRDGCDEGEKRAVVVLRSMKDCQLACIAVSRRAVGDKFVEVTLCEVTDTGIEIEFDGSAPDSGIEETIRTALQELKCGVKDVSLSSNVSAFVGFPVIKDAVRAQASLQSGALEIIGSASSPQPETVSSRLSVLPSFACEVSGYSVDKSVQSFDEALNDQVGFRKYERKAMIKLKRHLNVLPAMRALKKIEIDGVSLQPEQYEPMVGEQPSEYDTEAESDAFDRFSLKAVMKDYMHADPSTRYLIAKNRFERALHDAKVGHDYVYYVQAKANFILCYCQPGLQ